MSIKGTRPRCQVQHEPRIGAAQHSQVSGPCRLRLATSVHDSAVDEADVLGGWLTARPETHDWGTAASR